MSTSPPGSEQVLAQSRLKHVVYEFTRAAAMLGRLVGVGRVELEQLARVAYTQVLKDEGMPLAGMTEPLGFSRRTVSELNRALKELPMPIRSVLEFDVERIVHAARRPLLRSEIEAQLKGNGGVPRVRRLIQDLVARGRLAKVGHRYVSTDEPIRNADLNWEARFRGLRYLLDHVVGTAHTLFSGDLEPRGGSRPAFRTVSLEAAPGDLERVRKFYAEVFFPFITALESAAKQKGTPLNQVTVSLIWHESVPQPSSEKDEP